MHKKQILAQALKAEHRALDEEILAAQKSPSVDDLTIAALKKRKLAVKDEMFAIS